MSKSSRNIRRAVLIVTTLGALFLFLGPFTAWGRIPNEYHAPLIGSILLLIFASTFILARSDDEGRKLSHGCAFGSLLVVLVVVAVFLAFMLDMKSWG
jgi:hypothetical protein